MLPGRRPLCLSLMGRRHLVSIRKRGYHEISFLGRGDPSEVLQYHRCNRESPLQEDCVKIQMLQAPWNPADKNTIQGKYPSPQKSPPSQPPSARGEDWVVAGSEGWGTIEYSDDPEIPPRTFVTFGQSGMGTFRSSLWLPKRAIIPIDPGMELEEKYGPAASSLFQLGGTAWRMLQDFESLEGNSVVLQNAGNSGVGWMVSQLAAERNIQVVSLVRRGNKSAEQFTQMMDALTHPSTNTTQVVAEEDLLDDKDALKDLQAKLKKPARLAINAVGGDSASLLLKLLAKGGTMVTYGGMSMKPVTVATPQLIFKDIKVCGYWHSRWMTKAFSKDKKQMVDQLVEAVLDGNAVCPPTQLFQLSQIEEALEFESEQSTEAVRKKVVFDCREL